MNRLHEERILKIRKKMEERNFDSLIISDPNSIWYLSGIWNEPYERMYVLYIEKTGRIKFFVNRLFNIPENDFENIWYSDSDDYISMLSDEINDSGTVGVDKILPAKFLIPLIQKKSSVNFTLGSDLVDELRACKDDEEIKLMRESSRINDSCIEKAISFVREGMTEMEIAKFIDAEFLNEGADGNSFSTIVSFGANAADPHHEPDETTLKKGDCVLIDMGCRKNRYCSDMTRTVFYGHASEESVRIYETVKAANEKAESIIRPGIKISELDAAARNLICNAGYGKYFTHRLGHFIGQTEHEQGDVSSSNDSIAKEGMIFSIEPGIYIPGKVGVRIEDLVLVTKDGCEILNRVDKGLKIISSEQSSAQKK